MRIDKADWMQYLVWFRETLDIPVRNNVRLTRIAPTGTLLNAYVLATPDGPEVTFTREVVLATGIAGAGARRVPDFVRHGLPREVWAHTADPDRFHAALRGGRVASDGRRRVRNMMTTPRPRWNMARHGGHVPSGVTASPDGQYSGRWNPLASGGISLELDDATRWRFATGYCRFRMPPPRDSVDRVMRHANVAVRSRDADPRLPGSGISAAHAGRHGHDARFSDPGDRFRRRSGRSAGVVPRSHKHVSTWADRYALPG